MGKSLDVRQINKDIDIIQLKHESTQIPLLKSGNKIAYAGTDVTGTQLYEGATIPTIVANRFYAIDTLRGIAGKVIIVNKIKIISTSECNLALLVLKTLRNYEITLPSLSNYYDQYEGKLNTAGEYIFDFTDNPLIIYNNMSVSSTYWKNNTTGANFNISYYGFTVTADFNYNANKKCVIIGDSIGGITAELGAITENIWTFNVINRLINDGINIRHINKSIAGTNVEQWSNLVTNGEVDVISGDLFIFNIGTNDSQSSESILTQTTGIDGTFKTNYKKMIYHIKKINKNAAFVLNTPTPNNQYGQTIINSGIYTGQKMIDAIKQEIITIANELSTDGHNIKSCDLSSIFNPSDSSYYLDIGIHPNVKKGHPLIASAVYNSIRQLSNW